MREVGRDCREGRVGSLETSGWMENKGTRGWLGWMGGLGLDLDLVMGRTVMETRDLAREDGWVKEREGWGMRDRAGLEGLDCWVTKDGWVREREGWATQVCWAKGFAERRCCLGGLGELAWVVMGW